MSTTEIEARERRRPRGPVRRRHHRKRNLEGEEEEPEPFVGPVDEPTK